MRRRADPVAEFAAGVLESPVYLTPVMRAGIEGAWRELAALMGCEPDFPARGRASPDYRTYWQQRRAATWRAEDAVRRAVRPRESVPT